MKVYVAGHRGMVGSAILRALAPRGDVQVITRDRATLDLTDQASVRQFMQDAQPDVVILAAARVGGIHANSAQPASFIYDNLMIEANVIHQAFDAGVRRLLNLGSSCIYPRNAPQPIPERALLSAELEPTNEAYAIAKIAGIKLCESYNRQHGVDYRSLVPANLYGPGDNFHPTHSHVLPALMHRFDEAVSNGDDTVTIWGNGTARREFLHVDDLAAAALFTLDLPTDRYQAHCPPAQSHLNVGSGLDISILELARRIAKLTGFDGTIATDTSRPDGTPRRVLDVSRLRALGWQAQITLNDGLRSTYAWFLANRDDLRGVEGTR